MKSKKAAPRRSPECNPPSFSQMSLYSKESRTADAIIAARKLAKSRLDEALRLKRGGKPAADSVERKKRGPRGS